MTDTVSAKDWKALCVDFCRYAVDVSHKEFCQKWATGSNNHCNCGLSGMLADFDRLTATPPTVPEASRSITEAECKREVDGPGVKVTNHLTCDVLNKPWILEWQHGAGLVIIAGREYPQSVIAILGFDFPMIVARMAVDAHNLIPEPEASREGRVTDRFFWLVEGKNGSYLSGFSETHNGMGFCWMPDFTRDHNEAMRFATEEKAAHYAKDMVGMKAVVE